jgi:hypothetical protein
LHKNLIVFGFFLIRFPPFCAICVWRRRHLAAFGVFSAPAVEKCRHEGAWQRALPGSGETPGWEDNQIAVSPHGSQASAPHAVDDLPDAVPVGAQELGVIETYLGALLNELLGERQ